MQNSSQSVQGIEQGGELLSDIGSIFPSNQATANTVMSVFQLIMLFGFWVLKVKKRLRSNEEKVQVLERKMSQLAKTRRTTEL